MGSGGEQDVPIRCRTSGKRSSVESKEHEMIYIILWLYVVGALTIPLFAVTDGGVDSGPWVIFLTSIFWFIVVPAAYVAALFDLMKR